jgi:hypothetical protein
MTVKFPALILCYLKYKYCFKGLACLQHWLLATAIRSCDITDASIDMSVTEDLLLAP